MERTDNPYGEAEEQKNEDQMETQEPEERKE